MNFGEKLTNLRKQKGLSQEELGEKLNVTRQTISKWELGQTSPDSGKLTEIARFFEIGVNELTNEEEIDFSNPISENNYGSRKKSTGIIILIIVLVLSLIGIVFYATSLIIGNSVFGKLFKGAEDISKGAGKTLTSLFKTIDNKMHEDNNNTDNSEMYNKSEQIIENTTNEINNSRENSNIQNKAEQFIDNVTNEINNTSTSNSFDEEYDRKVFNMSIEHAQGTQGKFILSSYLDKIITSNKTNDKHIITVVYNETVTTTEDGIVGIKHSLSDKNKYEVSVDYDANKYINRVTIKDI